MSTPINEASTNNTSTSGKAHHKYLVIAADMAAYNGQSIGNYHLVMTCAVDDEEALETATSALEDGFLPLAAFSSTDLHQIADELAARLLEPARSYNVSAGMTDYELFDQEEENP